MAFVPPNNVPLLPVDYEQMHETSVVRAVAIIQGKRYQVSSWSIERNAHGATDAADVTLPLKGNPDFTVALFRDAHNTSQVPISIYLGVLQSQPTTQATDITGLTRIFVGQVDQYTTDYAGNIVTFHCRSLAAPLVDNRITQLARNMTTKQFVAAVAKQYGLTVNYQLAPGQQPITIADLYGDEFATGVQNQRIWDLLIAASQFDDVDVWVDGSVLNYAAPSVIKRTHVYVKWGKNLVDLSAVHSPLFSKAIRIEVRIYNPKTRQSTISRVETLAGGGVKITTSSKRVTSTPDFGTPNLTTTSVGPNGTTSTSSVVSGGTFKTTGQQGPNESTIERYTIYIRGGTPTSANQRAQAEWRRISMMEYAVTMHLPMSRAYFPVVIDSVLELSGTPNQHINARYWPRRITYTGGVDQDPMIEVEALSHVLPQGQV